jgi:hypothetical protein
MRWVSNTAQDAPNILMSERYDALAAINGSDTRRAVGKEAGNARSYRQFCCTIG